MDAQEFFKKIDWSELRNQKRTLLETIEAEKGGYEEMLKNLDGIVHLIDALQDYAVDELGINENHVFDFELEEQREKETPEEEFAREMAETVFELSVESDGIYFDIPEEMSREEVDDIVDNPYHADIIKSKLKTKILEDVLKNPNDFHRDEDGNLCYDYQLVTDYGGIVDGYVRHEFYKGRVKTLYRCPHCFSDNVEIKMWVGANTNKVSPSDYPMDEEDCWCNDCEQHGNVQLETIPYLEDVVGFRLVNNDGFCHPRLHNQGSDPLICNLSQAREMMEDVDKDGNRKWALQTIWADDEIDESLFIFSGDPRG